MKWFYNMKIAKRLISSFIVVALLAASVGIIGIVNINSININDTALYEQDTLPLSNLVNMTDDFNNIRARLRDVILNNGQNINSYTSEIKTGSGDFTNKSLMLSKSIKNNKENEILATINTNFAAYMVFADDLQNQVLTGQSDKALALLRSTQMVTANASVKTGIENLSALVKISAASKAKDNAAAANTAILLMVIVIGVSVLFAVLLGLVISNSISKPIKQMVDVADKLALGYVNVEVKSNTKDEIGKLMTSFSNMIVNTKGQAENIQKLADGNLDFEIIQKSDEDVLAISMKKVVDTLLSLVSDTKMLSDAAIEGKLNTRADVAKHSGEFRKIIQGVNDTLDSVVNPMREAEEVLGRMSDNDFTVNMSGNYRGDMHKLKESINSVAVRLLAAQECFVYLSVGDTSMLEKYSKIGRRSENDKLMPSVVAAMQSIHDLISESQLLANATVEGNLSVRGDLDKFKGGYKEIIEGMNRTMEAIEWPLHEISKVLSSMENKDFTVSMNGEYKGEYLKIKDAANNTMKAISEVLTEMGESSDQVADGSKQVSDASQSLSQGASEQASAIEQLSASITEIAAQTRQNAANATEAKELANKAKNDADVGTVQMRDMIKSMEEINESTIKVSKVIKVIDDIAFQTNMLALNAAVEAARAGQQGKGFAVVADEVRNLAARSANAVKETTEMIENSLKRAEVGNKIANETKIALDQIVIGVDKAAILVAEIAAASNEQATGISQINRGVEQISQVVQTNSATAEESAASSEELSSQAESLKVMVGKFTLKVDSERTAIKEPKSIIEIRSEFAKAAANKIPCKIALSQSGFGKY
jgi:methyl-accepting chemotaxis protein